MTSCCICFNEIQELTKADFQCQTCNSGIICHMCFTEKLDYIDTSKYHKKKDVIKEMMVCPCCRQVNWKQYHYVRIVDNMRKIIKKKEYKSKADVVFLENYRLMKDYKHCMEIEEMEEEYEREHLKMVEEEANDEMKREERA